MVSPVAIDISKNKRLDSTNFSEYTHCVRQGDRPNDLWDFKKAIPKDGWNYLGWCPSAATCKPESGWSGMDHHVAVLLCNDKEEEVWLHVPVTDEMIYAIHWG